MDAAADPVRVAQELGREGEPRAASRPARAVEEVGVRGPLDEAARRRRLASSCSGKVSKLSTDDLGDIFGVERPVDHDNPLGEAARSRGRHGRPPRRRRPLLLDAIGSPLRRAAASAGGRRMRNVRSGRSPPVARRLSSSTRSTPERGQALVGERGVEVAVGDDVGAARERGRITSSTSCARAAAKSDASAQGARPSPWSRISRIRSPAAVPPARA